MIERIKHIMSSFFDKEAVTECEEIKSGLINATYRVKVGIKNYILQRLNIDVFANPELIQNNLDLLDSYLNNHNSNYKLITPLSNKSGDKLPIDSNGNCYRIFEFIEDSKTISVVETTEQAYEAANQFGSFTAQFKDFDLNGMVPSIPDFHNLSLRFDQFKNSILTGDSNRINQSEKEINILLNYKFIVNLYNSMINSDNFKVRIMHHDAKISNVLFGPNDIGLHVIDLDTVMPGHIFSDWGDMMRTYISPANEEVLDLEQIIVRPAFIDAIHEGYLHARKDNLSQAESTSLIDSGLIIIYMQALRFMTDHLLNDVYYGAKYSGHNYHRSRNQIHLLNNLLSINGKSTIFPLI